MKRNRLVELMVRLARVLDPRLTAPADDGLPVDPSLLPRDLAAWPKTR